MAYSSMTASLQSLGSSLTYGLGASDRDRIALAYSLTSAQRVARSAASDPTSLAYFDAMSAQLVELGWVQWWSTQVDNAALGAADAGATNTEEWIGTSWSPALLTSARAIEQSWHALGAAVAKSPDAQALMDAWWPCTEIALSVRHMCIGPLVAIAGTPAVVLGAVNVRGQIETWRQLFLPDSDVHYTGCAVGLSLDTAVYASHAPALEASLRDEVESSIRHTQLDLD